DPARVSALADRLRLSNADRSRLEAWAMATLPAANLGEAGFARLAYREGAEPLRDRLRLALASARARAQDDDAALVEAGGYSRLLRLCEGWSPPRFPVSGDDLAGLGVPAGKGMGDLLRQLEAEWVDGGFAADRAALLSRATRLLQE